MDTWIALYCSLWECVDCRTRKRLGLYNHEGWQYDTTEAQPPYELEAMVEILKTFEVFCDRCARKPHKSAPTKIKIRHRRSQVAERVAELFLYLSLENEVFEEDETPI